MCISGSVHSDIIPPVFADNCSDELSIDSTLVTTIIDCHVIQTYTWTATDQCGNSTSASTSITTTDATPPVVDEYSIEVTVYCDQSDAIPAPTASDACSQVTMEYTDVLYSGGCPGTIGRSYTFTDQCGNAAYATQFITVLDNVAPVFNFVPEPRTFVCGEAYTAPASAQASDLCDSDVQVNFTSTIAPSDCPQQQLVINTWTAIDECLNQTSVQVTDTIIICPEIIEVTSCDQYEWFGEVYTASGSYAHYTSENDCITAYALELTINESSNTSFIEEACVSYTWNGISYNASGDYTQQFVNAAGCDSTVTLHLTINQPSSAQVSASACSSYTWNGQTYPNSGTTTYVTTNAVRSDSKITPALTTNTPTIS